MQMTMCEEETTEREKYQKVWGTLPLYRQISPGENVAPQAVAEFQAAQGSTLIDFGCGTGRALKIFEAAGFQVLGIDIAGNCLDAELKHTPLLTASLWRLPVRCLNCRFGFCADVMEHIPEQRVRCVLDGIADVVSDKIFFQIACFPHTLYSHLPLHLTVKDRDWWERHLEVYWSSVIHVPSSAKNRPVFVCSH